MVNFMKLRIKTGVFTRLPILKTIVGGVMKKFLDFTDYPYWRGQVKNIMRAQHATLRLEIDPVYREKLFGILDLLCPDEGLGWDLVRVS